MLDRFKFRTVRAEALERRTVVFQQLDRLGRLALRLMKAATLGTNQSLQLILLLRG